MEKLASKWVMLFAKVHAVHVSRFMLDYYKKKMSILEL
jgi:hypothetical protein